MAVVEGVVDVVVGVVEVVEPPPPLARSWVHSASTVAAAHTGTADTMALASSAHSGQPKLVKKLSAADSQEADEVERHSSRTHAVSAFSSSGVVHMPKVGRQKGVVESSKNVLHVAGAAADTTCVKPQVRIHRSVKQHWCQTQSYDAVERAAVHSTWIWTPQVVCSGALQYFTVNNMQQL